MNNNVSKSVETSIVNGHKITIKKSNVNGKEIVEKYENGKLIAKKINGKKVDLKSIDEGKDRKKKNATDKTSENKTNKVSESITTTVVNGKKMTTRKITKNDETVVEKYEDDKLISRKKYNLKQMAIKI